MSTTRNAIFMTMAEQAHLANVALDMEKFIMYGTPDTQKKEAKNALRKLLTEKKITFTKAKNILNMINSPSKDNLDFAQILLDTLLTQNVAEYVSNI